MKFLKINMIVFFLLLMIGCNTSENNTLIIGRWSGVEGLADGKPSGYNADKAQFTSNDKGDYTFDYSGNKETGKYKVENDMLFTTPAGQTEIMVKIMRLTKDSIAFKMNRGGRPELLTLVKK